MGSAARYVHLDVTWLSDWMEAVTAAHDTFGRLTVLVNNAGVSGRRGLEDTSEEESEPYASSSPHDQTAIAIRRPKRERSVAPAETAAAQMSSSVPIHGTRPTTASTTPPSATVLTGVLS